MDFIGSLPRIGEAAIRSALRLAVEKLGGDIDSAVALPVGFHSKGLRKPATQKATRSYSQAGKR